jgi:hypothetical protein
LKYQGSTNYQPGLQDLGFSQEVPPSVIHLQQSQFKLEKRRTPFTQLTCFGAVALFLNVFLLKLIEINNLSY